MDYCWKGFVQLDGEFDKWSKEDTGKSNWNNRRLSYIFNYVFSYEFHQITLCETSKEAWDILENAHEGSKGIVRKAKLQMLTSWFESMNMKEDETFENFYT